LCSSIKGLKEALQIVLMPQGNRNFPIFEVTPLELQNLQKSPDDRESNILIADNNVIGPLLYENPPRFQFIQGTWAGIDPLLNYIKPNVTPTVPICRFAHPIFSQLMAEYVVSQVINWERQIKEIHKWQDQKFWPPQMYMGRSLNDLQVGILGYGNMGKAVAKALQAFGSSVWTVKRQTSESMTDSVKILPMEKLSELLQNCDYVCNLLPKTARTTGILDSSILANCKDKKSIFINVGRANVISDDSILEALGKNWIGGAILDVFHEEPLPKDHPFWTHPKIIITPHMSALSRPQDIASCFKENLDLFLAEKPMKFQVNWNETY